MGCYFTHCSSADDEGNLAAPEVMLSYMNSFAFSDVYTSPSLFCIAWIRKQLLFFVF